MVKERKRERVNVTVEEREKQQNDIEMWNEGKKVHGGKRLQEGKRRKRSDIEGKKGR